MDDRLWTLDQRVSIVSNKDMSRFYFVRGNGLHECMILLRHVLSEQYFICASGKLDLAPTVVAMSVLDFFEIVGARLTPEHIEEIKYHSREH